MSAEMDAVIATGLAKDPADRYSSASDLAGAAAAAVTTSPGRGAVAPTQPAAPVYALTIRVQPGPSSVPTQHRGAVGARPPAPASAPAARGWRRPWLLVGAAAVVLVAVIVGVVIAFTDGGAESSTRTAPSAATPLTGIVPPQRGARWENGQVALPLQRALRTQRGGRRRQGHGVCHRHRQQPGPQPGPRRHHRHRPTLRHPHGTARVAPSTRLERFTSPKIEQVIQACCGCRSRHGIAYRQAVFGERGGRGRRRHRLCHRLHSL